MKENNPHILGTEKVGKLLLEYIVSLCIPFVVAYIGYAWWALSRKPQDGSKEELKY